MSLNLTQTDRDFCRTLLEQLGESPCVLEVGTKRQHDKPTSHKDLVLQLCPQAKHVGVDLESGLDVDVVADVHTLSQVFPRGHFDAVLLDAILEHVRRPWIVSRELAKVTKAGGLLWCLTCTTFPLHGYPSDYFRFSSEAMHEIFGLDSGWLIERAGYSIPARVQPLSNQVHYRSWNFEAPGFCFVEVVARRTHAEIL